MYCLPDHLEIVRQTDGAAIVKYFGSVEVMVQRHFFDTQDALDWCNANYHGIPYNVVG